MTIRIVIAVDLDEDTPAEAYRELLRVMGASNLDWESTDEWYDADGDPLSEEEIYAARVNPEDPPLTRFFCWLEGEPCRYDVMAASSSEAASSYVRKLAAEGQFGTFRIGVRATETTKYTTTTHADKAGFILEKDPE